MSQRTALLVVDMQNDFCLPTATLSVDGAMSCLPHVIQAVQNARELGVTVVWVVREHDAQGIPLQFSDTYPAAVPSAAISLLPCVS
mmetsp:Transcript_22842/g.63420  ORF Transcript_22842/g.63420 Transcript_22842/m.63420 type:complete len:86 (+) Transcript_22842:151-408(+)